MTTQEFEQRNNQRFAYNNYQNITDVSFRDLGLDISALVRAGVNTNAIPGAPKLVIYETQEQADRAGFPQRPTLEGLKKTSIACGNLGRIDVTPTGPVWLEAVYDDTLGPYPYGPGFHGLLDGSGVLDISGLPNDDPEKKGLAALKWVLKDSPEALEARTANIALYKKGTNYRGNDLVRWAFGTHATGFKTIVFSSNESGTDIPAPSRPEGDAYWSVFIPPPAEAFPWQTVTPAELRTLQAAGKYSTTRTYIVSPRMVLGAPGEDDIQLPDVFVRALLPNVLEPTGWAIVAADDVQLVNYDVATDTTTPVQSGAGSFADLQGSPYDNYPLANALYEFYSRGEVNNLLTNYVGPAVIIPASGQIRRYNTPQQGVALMQPDATLVIRGALANGLEVNCAGTVDMLSAVGGGGVVSFLPPKGSQSLPLTVRGFSANGRMVINRQKVNCTLRIEDFRGGSRSDFVIYTPNSAAVGVRTIIYLVNYNQRKTAVFDQFTAVFNWFVFDGGAEEIDLHLVDCTISSTAGAIFGGTISAGCRIYLEGTTTLDGGAYGLGGFTSSATGNPIPLATVLVDNRPPATGGTVKSVNGILPNPAGNVTVEVGSPAIPNGTGTAVTFDKERHWPVISSGTYTLSAAGAVVDVCLQLVLALGASAIAIPSTGFVKMTSTQFNPAKENTYSFCVRVDGQVQYYINQPQ